MRDMERLKPAVVGPTNLQAIDTRDPRLKTGSGKGSGPQLPGSGTSFTPDRQPKNPRKSHKVRNSLLVGALGVAGAGVYVGTQGGTESSPTTTPVVTTIDIQPTSPSSPVTTSVEPSTTVEQKPTDVVEHRDGYDVLRNGLYLYPIDSVTVNGSEINVAGVGGIELGIRGEQQSQYEFKKAETGQQTPQEVIFTDLLTAFANQKGMPLQEYIDYLKQNNWIDATAYFPDNVSEPGEHAKYPPVVKVPVSIDFKQPFVLSNQDLGQVDGLDPFTGTFDYYYPTPSDDTRSLLAVSSGGQLMYSLQGLRISTGEVMGVLPDASVMDFSIGIGNELSIISGLGIQAESPQAQWLYPYLSYAVPAGRVDPATIPNYEQWKTVVMNLFNYATTDFTSSKLFTKTA